MSMCNPEAYIPFKHACLQENADLGNHEDWNDWNAGENDWTEAAFGVSKRARMESVHKNVPDVS